MLASLATHTQAQTPYLWYAAYDSVGATTTRSLRGLAIAPDDATLYLGWIQGSSTRAIRLVTAADGNVIATTNVGSTAFNGLATDDRGFVYAARGSTSTSMVIYDAATTTVQGSVATAASGNNGVSIFRDGSSYYAYLSVGSAIRRYDVTDETSPVLDTSWASSGILAAFGSAVLRGIHVDSSGVIYATARDSNEVFRVSSGLSPSVTATSTAVTAPMDVTTHGGAVFVASYAAASSYVAQLDPTTLTLVGSISTGHSRGSLEGYSGIAATADGELYVADQIYAGTGTVTSDRVLFGSPNNKTFTVTSGSTTVTSLLAGDGGVVKAGSGTLVLSGNNTYTGSTTISAGTLVINGDHSAAIGDVSVGTSATLAGTGTIGGTTTIAGSHAPGSSPGLQTFLDGVTYETDSNFAWELIDNTAAPAGRGTSYDAVDVSGGTLTIESGVTTDLIFDGVGSTVDWTDSLWDSDQSWLVFDNANAPSGNFDNFSISIGLDSLGATLASARPTAVFAWAFDGDDVVLTYTASAPNTPTPTEAPATHTPTHTPIFDTPTPTEPPATSTPTEVPNTPTPAPSPTFSFAGFSWDQINTPDVILTLAPGDVNGAIVTAVPNTATANIGIGFPSTPAGFDDSLTLGRMLSLSATGVRAVNLPAGNDGTAHRSGFQVSWSGGRKLQNLPGVDFVVYESASNSSTPEAFMVQVYDLGIGAWSPWYYKAVDGFQVYNNEVNAGATATGFDLDDFGVGAGIAIDRIRLVNMTHRDRMVDPSRIGFVLPEDNGNTSTHTPDPGPSASFGIYGASTLDPDPLYIAALHPIDSAACGNGVIEPLAGEACDPGTDVPDDCCDASCQFVADSTSCDDGDYCTVSDTCAAGICGGAARDCDDNNQCTADSCDSNLETCVNDAAPLQGAGCDDGLFCTVSDVCDAGSCGGIANSCDDSNDCTFDSCDEGGAQCLNDGAPFEGFSCNDGDACTASSACESGVCTGSNLIVTCGDGLVCGPEECDDGNVDELDGCSTNCEFEHLLNQKQKNCIRSVNAVTNKVGDLQGRVSNTCIRDGGRETIADAQVCVESDVKQRVANNQARAVRTEARACTDPPLFGKGDIADANTATRDESIAIIADVFGANVQSALILQSVDRNASRCQHYVAVGYERIASRMRREFYNCKLNRMRRDEIRSRSSLEACYGNWTVDPDAKLFKARQRLIRTLDRFCDGQDLAVTFPGECAARPDLSTCIEERVACRVCRAINVVDALTTDCDWLDDGTVNSSCP